MKGRLETVTLYKASDRVILLPCEGLSVYIVVVQSDCVNEAVDADQEEHKQFLLLLNHNSQ